jgi:hypothetical protein
MNGIEYFKNYISVVRGSRVEIFNCYEREDVLLPLTQYNQITLNGTIHTSAANLQAALQPIIYSRSTLGGDEPELIYQNNIGKVINIGYLSGLNINEAIQLKINALTTEITPQDNPVFFVAYKTSPTGNQKLTYQFMGGKGTWGIGGMMINLSQLQQLSALSIIPDDITLDDKSKVVSLDNITQGQFLATANASVRDFTDTSKLHYLSYSLDNVLHVKRFIGEPGEYGGDEDLLSEGDFEDITNSDVKPIAVVPTLEEIISKDNVITTPLTTSDNNTGSKILYKGSGIDYESLDGFTTKIGYEQSSANVNYKIPAKAHDDTFAMKSDLDHVTAWLPIDVESLDQINSYTLAQHINNTLSFTVTDKDIPPLLYVFPLDNPNKAQIFQLVSIGKGIYGLDNIQLSPENLMPLSAIGTTFDDILKEGNVADRKKVTVIDTFDQGNGFEIVDPDMNQVSHLSSADYSLGGRQGVLSINNTTNSNRISIYSDFISFTVNNANTAIKPGNSIEGVTLTLPNTSGTLATTANVSGLTLTANQSASEVYLKNSDGDTLATLNVGFLNNEGTTFVYNPTTEKLELRNDQNVLLSEVPVSAFVSNMLSGADFNATTPSQLDFKDSEGNVVFSANYTINNIAGLQAAIANKISLGGDSFQGDMVIGSANASPFTLMAQGSQLLKMYADRISILGSTKIEHFNNLIFSMSLGQNNQAASITRMTTGNTRVLEIFNNHAQSTGDIIGYGASNIILAGVTKNGNIWGADAVQNNQYATLGQVINNIPTNYLRPAVNTPITKYNVWAGSQAQYEALSGYSDDCIYLISESPNPYFTNNTIITTGQSANGLNMLYPNAPIGFTVSCPNISGAPVAYVKTTSTGQWITQNIIILNP